MTDTANGRAADTTHALSQRVDGLKDPSRLFIQKQVVVTKVRAGKVPVKILGLRIKCKSIRNQWVDRLHDPLDFLRLEICRRRQLFWRGIPFTADTFKLTTLFFCSCTHFSLLRIINSGKTNRILRSG